jgi:hydrogenase-4 membrane subunit HyfE
VSPVLVALLGVLLIPLFLASWRASLFGLAAQGVLMAMVAWGLGYGRYEPGDWLTLLDLAFLRGVIAPYALYAVLRAVRAPARHDVIPPNMLSWTVALGMALVAFSLAEQLVPEPGEQRTLVAVAASGLLLGFLVLATQSSPAAQMIGALRLENAIALLELHGPRREEPVALQVALLVVFAVTVLFFRFYLRTLAGDPTPEVTSAEGPTL